MEVPHLLALAPLAGRARLIPDRSQTADQMGRGWHLGERKSISPATAMHGPWPSSLLLARRVTHRLSRPRWRVSVFRGADAGGRELGRKPCWRIARIRPVRSAGISAGAGPLPSFLSRPTRSVAVCSEGAPAVAHLLKLAIAYQAAFHLAAIFIWARR